MKFNNTAPSPIACYSFSQKAEKARRGCAEYSPDRRIYFEMTHLLYIPNFHVRICLRISLEGMLFGGLSSPLFPKHAAVSTH